MVVGSTCRIVSFDLKCNARDNAWSNASSSESLSEFRWRIFSNMLNWSTSPLAKSILHKTDGRKESTRLRNKPEQKFKRKGRGLFQNCLVAWNVVYSL